MSEKLTVDPHGCALCGQPKGAHMVGELWCDYRDVPGDTPGQWTPRNHKSDARVVSEKGWSLYECEAAIRAGDDPLVVLRYAMNAAAERASAAAEERGRRRGVEERDNALKAAHDYCLYMFKRQWLTDPRNRDIFAARIFEILDAALAPRDSGKEADELMRALRDSATVSTRPPPSRK